MTLQEIEVGTRLELDILSKYGEKVGNTLVSQFLEHQEDGTMIISAPISESKVVYIPSDTTIRLIFPHKLHGMLGFTANVVSREYMGKIAVMIIQPESDLEKIQRRMHYRLDIILDAVIIPIQTGNDNSADKIPSMNASLSADGSGTAGNAAQPEANGTQPGAAENPDGIKVYTKNISGSGICVVSETDFPRNTNLMVIIDLTDKLQIRAKCAVVRSQMLRVRKGRSYELGLRFTDIRSKDQDALIRFIFEQQRILLRNEK